MERVIKFRAWDTKQRVLITPENAEYFEDKFTNDHDYYGDEWYPCYLFQEYVREIKSNRYIIMQYTGLKDNSKEGVCIYEGDIVSLSGIVIGNIYEMDKGETDIVIQDFGGKTWCKTYNEAISRGCRHSE